jgi:superfamily II DNA/RNA helicase
MSFVYSKLYLIIFCHCCKQPFKILSESYDVKCILGLTATATNRTIDEIREYFHINNSSNIIKDCDLPNNLIISASKDINKEKSLIDLLVSDEFRPFLSSVIIYCSRRELTEKIAQLLRSTFYANKRLLSRLSCGDENYDYDCVSIAEAYHAGLSAQYRKRIQNQFVKGKTKIIVATNAFGMGINLSSIRAIIHFNMPKSIENYVQEIGRAGRDGQLSRCHLFLESLPSDINEIKKYIYANGYDQMTIKKLIFKIFECCCCQNSSSANIENENDMYNHYVALPIADTIDSLDLREESILTLLCYLQKAGYIKLYANCYKNCMIKSYKGAEYLKQLAKTNAFASLLFKASEANQQANDKSITSAELKIDMLKLCELTKSGDMNVVKQKLWGLQWQESGNSQRTKSGISTEYTNLCFYLKRKCIDTESKLDDIYDYLWKCASTQMQQSCINFKALHKILSQYSSPELALISNESNQSNLNDNKFSKNVCDNSLNLAESKTECNRSNDSGNAESLNTSYNLQVIENSSNSNESKIATASAAKTTKLEKNKQKQHKQKNNLEETAPVVLKKKCDKLIIQSDKIKLKLNEYFRDELDVNNYISGYDFDYEKSLTNASTSASAFHIESANDTKRLITDIKKFIYTYSDEFKLNGMIIARIFHGIATPRFPSEIWGRNRLYWRCHLDFDFEKICKIATEQLLNT